VLAKLLLVMVLQRLEIQLTLLVLLTALPPTPTVSTLRLHMLVKTPSQLSEQSPLVFGTAQTLP
jgi:hypothetical protein